MCASASMGVEPATGGATRRPYPASMQLIPSNWHRHPECLTQEIHERIVGGGG